MWLVPYLVCVGRPLTPVCVVKLRWKGTRKPPPPPFFLTLAVFRCSAWSRVHNKPADSGTNTAVKHQSWQLSLTCLITAYSSDHICVCVPHYMNAHSSFVLFLTSNSVFCQAQVADFKSKLNPGSINNIFGTDGNTQCFQHCKNLHMNY